MVKIRHNALRFSLPIIPLLHGDGKLYSISFSPTSSCQIPSVTGGNKVFFLIFLMLGTVFYDSYGYGGSMLGRAHVALESFDEKKSI